MKNTLVLIRGIPGSGKSTLAKSMHGYCHYEADDFFTQPDGTYKFVAADIAQAHRECKQKAYNSLEEGHNVVVSNTFTRLWEMADYIDMARELGCNLAIIPLYGRFKNAHGVPEEAIEKMIARWEDA